MSATEDPRAELGEIAAALAAEAAELRRGWEELLAAVDAASNTLSAGAPGGEPGAPAGQDPRRLIALELALQGRSIEEVRSYLEERFGPVAGTDELLEDVFRPAPG